MLTPTQLATTPNVKSITLPDYDFQRQARGTGLEMAYTGSSVQTFDDKGQPKDSQSDNND